MSTETLERVKAAYGERPVEVTMSPDESFVVLRVPWGETGLSCEMVEAHPEMLEVSVALYDHRASLERAT